MLKFDSEGYLFICAISEEEWRTIKDKAKRVSSSSKISTKVLAQKSGTLLLQVSGRWLAKGKKLDPNQKSAFDFFRSMERSPMYSLGAPSILGNAIRFKIAGEGKMINELLSGLKQLKIPYSVRKLGQLEAKGDSLLSELTLQQARVLGLAHTMGYYDIPRKTSTEELAKILQIDKATVGEHLRRAEKHVFDMLIAG
jgi:hypothetical protein